MAESACLIAWNKPMNDKKFWYYGFRQTIPAPPGTAIACGPFESYEKARFNCENSKAWDCELSIPFSAADPEEAAQLARRYLG